MVLKIFLKIKQLYTFHVLFCREYENDLDEIFLAIFNQRLRLGLIRWGMKIEEYDVNFIKFSPASLFLRSSSNPLVGVWSGVIYISYNGRTIKIDADLNCCEIIFVMLGILVVFSKGVYELGNGKLNPFWVVFIPTIVSIMTYIIDKVLKKSYYRAFFQKQWHMTVKDYKKRKEDTLKNQEKKDSKCRERLEDFFLPW